MHILEMGVWWKFIVRFEIMTFSDRSCLWVHLMVISAEFTQHHGCSKGTGCTFKKPGLIPRGVFLRHDIWENSQNLHKEVFHRTWYMVRKDKEEVRSSSVSSAVSVRPLYQLGEKHHQIRAYILLIQVIEVRHLVRRFFSHYRCFLNT